MESRQTQVAGMQLQGCRRRPVHSLKEASWSCSSVGQCYSWNTVGWDHTAATSHCTYILEPKSRITHVCCSRGDKYVAEIMGPLPFGIDCTVNSQNQASVQGGGGGQGKPDRECTAFRPCHKC